MTGQMQKALFLIDILVKDQNTGKGFVPLSKPNKGNKKFEIYDSLLSEEVY